MTMSTPNTARTKKIGINQYFFRRIKNRQNSASVLMIDAQN